MKLYRSSFDHVLVSVQICSVVEIHMESMEIDMESMGIHKELMEIYKELMEEIVVASSGWIEQKTMVYFLPNLTNQ